MPLASSTSSPASVAQGGARPKVRQLSLPGNNSVTVASSYQSSASRHSSDLRTPLSIDVSQPIPPARRAGDVQPQTAAANRQIRLLNTSMTEDDWDDPSNVNTAPEPVYDAGMETAHVMEPTVFDLTSTSVASTTEQDDTSLTEGSYSLQSGTDVAESDTTIDVIHLSDYLQKKPKYCDFIKALSSENFKLLDKQKVASIETIIKQMLVNGNKALSVASCHQHAQQVPVGTKTDCRRAAMCSGPGEVTGHDISSRVVPTDLPAVDGAVTVTADVRTGAALSGGDSEAGAAAGHVADATAVPATVGQRSDGAASADASVIELAASVGGDVTDGGASSAGAHESTASAGYDVFARAAVIASSRTSTNTVSMTNRNTSEDITCFLSDVIDTALTAAFNTIFDAYITPDDTLGAKLGAISGEADLSETVRSSDYDADCSNVNEPVVDASLPEQLQGQDDRNSALDGASTLDRTSATKSAPPSDRVQEPVSAPPSDRAPEPESAPPSDREPTLLALINMLSTPTLNTQNVDLSPSAQTIDPANCVDVMLDVSVDEKDDTDAPESGAPGIASEAKDPNSQIPCSREYMHQLFELSQAGDILVPQHTVPSLPTRGPVHVLTDSVNSDESAQSASSRCPECQSALGEGGACPQLCRRYVSGSADCQLLARQLRAAAATPCFPVDELMKQYESRVEQQEAQQQEVLQLESLQLEALQQEVLQQLIQTSADVSQQLISSLSTIFQALSLQQPTSLDGWDLFSDNNNVVEYTAGNEFQTFDTLGGSDVSTADAITAPQPAKCPRGRACERMATCGHWHPAWHVSRRISKRKTSHNNSGSASGVASSSDDASDVHTVTNGNSDESKNRSVTTRLEVASESQSAGDNSLNGDTVTAVGARKGTDTGDGSRSAMRVGGASTATAILQVNAVNNASAASSGDDVGMMRCPLGEVVSEVGCPRGRRCERMNECGYHHPAWHRSRLLSRYRAKRA